MEIEEEECSFLLECVVDGDLKAFNEITEIGCEGIMQVKDLRDKENE